MHERKDRDKYSAGSYRILTFTCACSPVKRREETAGGDEEGD
jgi:hypothetical protein